MNLVYHAGRVDQINILLSGHGMQNAMQKSRKTIGDELETGNGSDSQAHTG